MLRSFIVVSLTALYTAIAGLLLLPFEMLTGRNSVVYRAGTLGVRLAVWLSGTRVRVEGRERLAEGGTYLFMSNHVSNFDIAAIAFLPRVAGLAKHEIFRIPFLGRAMRVVGFIPVVRGSQQAAASVEAGVARLQGGRSLLVFPEGTRSTAVDMLPFRRGVFVMAIRAGVPIVPVSISGTRDIMRKGDPRIYPGEVRIVLHEPIPTEGLTERERFQLADRVREVIAAGLAANEELRVNS